MLRENPADVVCLTLPQKDHLSKVIRLTTSAVASKTGLNLDEVDDLHTGLDELFRLFLADKRPPSGRLCIRYNIYPKRLEVITQGISNDLFDGASKINRYSRFILEQIADRVEEIPSPQGGYEIILVKDLSS